MQRTAIKIASIVFSLTLVATAQEIRSDVGVQGMGFFTQNSSGNSWTQNATETGGFLASYRYHVNRWLSVEAAYGYARNTQKSTTDTYGFGQQANLHQMTAGFVVSLPVARRWKISPYLIAEGGALIFDPTGNSYGITSGSAQRQTRGAFVYGGGMNFAITKRIALRAEYRGLVYHTPDFQLSSLGSGNLTQSGQPSMGIVFRF